jgi:hypothetical protein
MNSKPTKKSIGKCGSTSKNKIRDTYERDGLVRTFHGIVYQIKLILLFMIRAANKNCNFRIASERKISKLFDDIEFQYNSDGKWKNRMIQVKHKQDATQKITLADLKDEENGDFSLSKHFISYLNIKKQLEQNESVEDLIIFTNIDMNEKTKIHFEELPLDADDVLNISEQSGKRFLKLKSCSNLRKYFVNNLRNNSDLFRLTKMLDDYIKNEKKNYFKKFII